MKEVKIIIRISKKEMEYLVSNGIGYAEGGIKSTTGHHKSWYVTTSKKCLALLDKYRKEFHHDSVK